MTKRRGIKFFFITSGITFLLLGVLPQNSFAQSNKVDRAVEKRQEKLKKQEAAKEQKAEEQLEAKRQRFYDIQSKSTQKEMKRNKKKSKKLNDGRQKFFLSRWFKKN